MHRLGHDVIRAVVALLTGSVVILQLVAFINLLFSGSLVRSEVLLFSLCRFRTEAAATHHATNNQTDGNSRGNFGSSTLFGLFEVVFYALVFEVALVCPPCGTNVVLYW